MGDPYDRLTLSQLREKAKLSANPNDYSARSWLQNAVRTAGRASEDDAAGDRERAFVGYLKACGFFQAFLGHREVAAKGREGWGEGYGEFVKRRGEYLARARELEGILKQRAVERGRAEATQPLVEHSETNPLPERSENQHEQSEKHALAGMTPIPLTPAPTTPVTSFASAASEPDTTSGGSIAARLAALKGAGMQVNLSTKRTSRDLGTPTHPSHTPTPTPTSTNGNDRAPSRRGSVASQNGLVPGTPRLENGIEGNKTGSSINSVRSFERYQPPASNVPTGSPRTPAVPLGPAPALRALPTPPTTAIAPQRTSRSSTAPTAGKPEVIQEDDELAYFSTQFPSLVEFEGKTGDGVEVSGPVSSSIPEASLGSIAGQIARPTSGVPDRGFASTNGRDPHISLPSTPREISYPSSPVPPMDPTAQETRNKPPLPPTPNEKPKALSTAKPSLPFTNAIMPDTLFGYLRDPSLSLLLVDTRSGEEHGKGWIGEEEQREGRAVNCVWVDPTILSRPGYVFFRGEVRGLALTPPADSIASSSKTHFPFSPLQNTRRSSTDSSSTSSSCTTRKAHRSPSPAHRRPLRGRCSVSSLKTSFARR